MGSAWFYGKSFGSMLWHPTHVFYIVIQNATAGFVQVGLPLQNLRTLRRNQSQKPQPLAQICRFLQGCSVFFSDFGERHGFLEDSVGRRTRVPAFLIWLKASRFDFRPQHRNKLSTKFLYKVHFQVHSRKWEFLWLTVLSPPPPPFAPTP